MDINEARELEEKFKMKHNYRLVLVPCCDRCKFSEWGYESDIDCQLIQGIVHGSSGYGVSPTGVCDLFEERL